MTLAKEQIDAFPTDPHAHTSGMSLRDYFAGQVMALCFAATFKDEEDYPAKFAASKAYQMADAMMKARQF